MDSALFYYNRLLEMEPENERGILSLIEYYKTNQDSANVMKYFKKFILIFDNALENKIELISSFISDNNFRVKFSTDLIHITDSLINVNPNSENLYLLKADFYLRNKDNFKAKETLVYIVSNFKANYIIWEQLLFTLNSLTLNEDLIFYSNKALSLFNDKPIVYLFKGIAHYNLKNYSESIQCLTKGLNYIKDKKEVAIQIHTYLGENYQAISDYAKSEFHFEKVLQYDPENIMVLNNYSYYLSLRNSQLDKAANYIKICISKFPNSSTYLDTYGWILYKSGNLSQAKTTIEKALQNGGQTNMEIIEHYSEVLYYYGDKTNAIIYYKILEENGKSNLSLKRLLEID
jgi:tetratricopeptide (TPR) repeat protein